MVAQVKRKRTWPIPCSTYIYFSNEMCPKLQEERPDSSKPTGPSTLARSGCIQEEGERERE